MKTHSFSRLALAMTAIGLSATMAAAPAEAGSRINNRQAEQHQRIRQGVKSGQLTQAEAARLRAQQRSIAHYEAQARRSGNGLSARERTVIENRQDRASRAIHRQRHDGQARN